MMQQMLFARPSSSSAWQQSSPASFGGNSNLPQRVVTFAVQNVQPSPVVYRTRAQEQSPYVVDQTEEVSPIQQRPRSQQRIQRTTRPTAVHARPRARRPGWDDDVNRSSILFDTSLKKSVLFQPRIGARREQERAEKKHVAPTTRSKQKKTPSAQMTPVRYRSGPSSVYAQQRNVTRWPQRRAKDFVRQNIEHLTGRPVDGHFNRSETRSGSRENVFERLSAQRVSKSLLRMVPPPAPTEPDPLPAQSPRVSPLSPPQADSPVLIIDPPAPDKQNSIGSTTPSPVPRTSLGLPSPYSSPQRSQRSSSSRNSPAIRSASTKRRSGPSSRTRHYDNYPSRVFGVLDRDNERRIGVSQILQGLRLLGLPATHNQISDYVYLIHEGRHNSIDLEEWEILVGTLDAVSRPSSHSPRNPHAGQGSAIPSRSPSMRSISEHSPHDFIPSRSPPSRSDHPTHTRDQTQGTLIRRDRVEPHDTEEFFSLSVERKAVVSAEHQPIPEDDPYLEEIQNRIEMMFEKAQATAALRWAPGPGNNQIEIDPDHSNSDRILNRAASVVYNLRASLFPLVHQAEATLREIQQRHGSKLSLFLSPQDMAAIAQNSDVLASAILDDILLDTLQFLNEEDKHQSRRQLDARHADQLDDILTRIQEIEREENSMIHQGLALSYQTLGAQCGLPTATTTNLEMLAKPPRQKSIHLPNLRLPLGVVLNVKIDDSDTEAPQRQVSPRSAIQAAELKSSFDFGSEIPTQQILLADGSVKTSILQGKRLQSIERRRHKFQHHRRLVESSLAETGMTQYAVIEMYVRKRPTISL
ncbi:hypothetical protein V7S43_007967 [Phytophthora oleae]|uniref:EF-hand domain-containing protein n=1 Tax=Phytophthora oleae TaxID=2107226 RepID=A0ABD3FJD9_9STRA